ncbi:preprotein translocase subunit SecE [Candidatus Dojkabacteria bacterium]|nr:preprotein translocase subunit SecE [Candidatus Dojkabacteria bacterium]
MKHLYSLIEEFKRVEWPTRKQIVKYSFYTLLFLIVSSIGVGLLDVFFAFGRSWLISYISSL